MLSRWGRLVTAGALLLGSRHAAALELELPPGERPSAWVEARAAAEALEDPSSPAHVALSEAGDGRWRLVVGAAERLVRPPQTPQERQDLLFLAVALARASSGLGWGDLPPPVTDAPEASAPADAEVAAPVEPMSEPLEPEPAVAPVAAEEVASAGARAHDDAVPAPPEAPREEAAAPAAPAAPPSAPPTVEQGVVRTARTGPEVPGALWLGLGVRLAPFATGVGGRLWLQSPGRRLQLAGGLSGLLPTRVHGVRDPARVWVVDLGVQPLLRVGDLSLGPRGGLSVRTFLDGEVRVARILVPELGGGLLWALPLDGPLRLSTWAQGAADLRRTDLRVGEARLDPGSWTAEVGLQLALGRSR